VRHLTTGWRRSLRQRHAIALYAAIRMGRQLQALASMQNGLEGVKKPSPRQKFLQKLVKIPFNMVNKK
jgi:hypothetical protein